jgi:ribosome-binding factor A
MSSIRQNRIEAAIQEAVSKVFQREGSMLTLGSLVTVTAIRITPDLSMARCYLSIFSGPPMQEVMDNIEENKSRIRGEVGKRLKNMRKIPELRFVHDDSLDYAEEINNLLK